MAITLTIVFLAYAALQGYVLHGASAALGLGTTARVAAAAWIALMTLMPLILWRLERLGAHRPVVAGSWLAYSWMGLAFLWFSTLAAFDIASVGVHAACAVLGCEAERFLPPPDVRFLAASALAVLLSVYGFIDAGRVRVRRVVLHSRKLRAPLTLVQISDVHLGAIVGRSRLDRIVAAAAGASPDILVSTGDLLDGQADHLDGLSTLLASVNPRYGKFAVIGNHECYVGIARAIEFHERAGFRVLRGEGVTVAGINIAGMDDPAASLRARTRANGEEEVLRALSPDRFTVLLKHQPLVDRRSRGLFDLQLSGHVHGGQIFPFGLLSRLTYRVGTGLHDRAGGWLYVSPGAGTWGPPMRVLAPPEVTVFELRPEGSEAPVTRVTRAEGDRA